MSMTLGILVFRPKNLNLNTFSILVKTRIVLLVIGLNQNQTQ